MENPNLPKHIAIIMDGNRRWAKERGLPSFDGHWEGYNTLKKITRHCFNKGIKVLTVYAFSTEKWDRPEVEIKVIFKILIHGLNKEIKEFVKEGIKVNFIGQTEKFPVEIKKKLDSAMKKTSGNNNAILNVAINYGGRAEIVDTIKKLINQGHKANEISEELVSKNL
jgi:undecaprenyl diphosphate synthase